VFGLLGQCRISLPTLIWIESIVDHRLETPVPTYQVDLAEKRQPGMVKTVPITIEKDTREEAWDALFSLCDAFEERIGKGWSFTAYTDDHDSNPNALGILVPPKGKIISVDKTQARKRAHQEAKTGSPSKADSSVDAGMKKQLAK
jgi:hypothetical protein